MKNSYGLVYVTTSGRMESERLARMCVAAKLAACVNIVPRVVSHYEWEGGMKKEQESLMFIKTRADLFNQLSSFIKKHHSYECPCIVFMPVSKGNLPFLTWVNSQLKKTARGRLRLVKTQKN